MGLGFGRRDFIFRAAALLPALHPSFLFAPSVAASPAPAEPVEFLHLRLRARRMDEQRAFYAKTLGLPLVAESSDSLTFRAGGTTLEFVQAEPQQSPLYHFAFNIPENKLEAAIQWLAGRAPLIRRRNGEHILHFPSWNAHSIYFADPSGNLLEFIARHNLPNAAPGPFDTPDILYGSEIGLIGDVDQIVGALSAHFEVGVYVGRSSDFAPVGDEHGLFIVAQTGRPWLLIDTPAAIFPTEVRLRRRGSRTLSPAGLPYRIAS